MSAAELRLQLGADHSNAFANDLKSKLVWQAGLFEGCSADNATNEEERRNAWQREALQAAADVVPHLRKALLQRETTDGARSRCCPPQSNPMGAPEPTLALLIEIGWIAWGAGLEADALRILGGVGGAADGATGLAMFKASAFINHDRAAEAAAVLDESIARWGDPRGEMSSTLVMLWLSLGNTRWKALARKVVSQAPDAKAREICADALNSHAGWPIGQFN
jgi:hypothetical protein